MRRFGRALDVERMRESMPLSVFFFDCLRRDDDDLVAPAGARALRSAGATSCRRRCAFRGSSPATSRPRRRSTTMPCSAQHEGVMVKALDAPYEPGSRSAAWLKVKRAHTLDLVVLAAEWGHGRRRGWLSNLHLGARDPATGEFVMLGKTFKGMTDAMLEWQTKALLEREVDRDDWTVDVRPELVVEITFNDLQASPRYPGGLALRFARVKGYRPRQAAGRRGHDRHGARDLREPGVAARSGRRVRLIAALDLETRSPRCERPHPARRLPRSRGQASMGLPLDAALGLTRRRKRGIAGMRAAIDFADGFYVGQSTSAASATRRNRSRPCSRPSSTPGRTRVRAARRRNSRRRPC